MLQVAQAQAQEAEAALKALRADSERAKQQFAEQHAKLESQLAEMKQQLQRATSDRKLQVWNVISRENFFTIQCMSVIAFAACVVCANITLCGHGCADVQAAELHAEITSLQQQLQDQHDRSSAAAAKQAHEHEQQLHELQEGLQAAVSRAAVQHAEDVEASGQLRARLQETESQLAVMRAERDALQVTEHADLAVLCCAVPCRGTMCCAGQAAFTLLQDMLVYDAQHRCITIP